MEIAGTYYSCELSDILDELANQLQVNGIQLLQKRKNLQTHIQVCCPYHNNGQERRPSAGIRKTDGLFHCFTCNEVHSLPEVISHCFGVEDDIFGKFGKKWLLKNFKHLETEERPELKLDTSRHTEKPKIQYVTEEELDKYRYIHPYMYKRRLTDEIIEMFDIGYDESNDCLTFPVRDINGHTLFIARRHTKYKQFYYPQGVEKPLYGLYEVHRQMLFNPDFDYEIIVCESMLDALTCWVYGKYAVALNGLGTDLQLKQLKSLPCRKLILATDNDKAGRQARERIREAIDNRIITEYIFPKGVKDINDLDLQGFQELEEIF